MRAYPIVVDGTSISALIVGGGAVAARKAIALLDAGATVRMVAPAVDESLEERAAREPRLTIVRSIYTEEMLDGATLVIAATNDAGVNAAVADDARARGQLVNVVDAPQLGNFVTPAVHRAGDLVVAVSAGGVPTAAARIRDAIGSIFGEPFGAAVRELALLRRTLLSRGDRDAWSHASKELIGEDFCDNVRDGSLSERVAAWR